MGTMTISAIKVDVVMRVFLGSASRELARLAPCSLLVIPRGG